MDDQIEFIVADLDRFTEGEIIALGLNVNANLRDSPPLGTPIKTGWASANWVPSVGEPKIIDLDLKEPTPQAVAAMEMVADRGLNEILRFKLGQGAIYSTNNVPYIVPLNDGHSPQSPPGFVQAAMEKAVRETEVTARSRATPSSRGKGPAGNGP